MSGTLHLGSRDAATLARVLEHLTCEVAVGDGRTAYAPSVPLPGDIGDATVRLRGIVDRQLAPAADVPEPRLRLTGQRPGQRRLMPPSRVAER